jgi:hypothetical protein
MFTAERLLRLYPRGWRERYGEEFLAMLGATPLQAQQVIDIVSGAIDAWLSSDVRGATRVATSSSGGVTMVKAISICQRNQQRYTTRDGLISAGVMLAVSAVFVVIGMALRRSGWTESSQVLLSLSMPVSMSLSMPFWLMKDQPRKAQFVITAGTLLILAASGYLSTII